MRSIDVALTPELLHDAHDRDTVAIDVLRATTTMLAAFGSGVARIIPVETVEDALKLKRNLPDAILCGERDAVPPEGFDLGNSPLTMTPARVSDRTLVMSTTNGTRAIHRCADAARVLIGAVTNRAVVADALSAGDRGVTLVCSGTHGRVSLDDVIGAGLIIERLLEHGTGFELSDAARITLETTHESIRASGSILNALRSAAHGRTLDGLGMGADIGFAARIDGVSLVPIWDPQHNEIRVR